MSLLSPVWRPCGSPLRGVAGLFRQAHRDCPKSPEKLRTEASKPDETGPRSSISLPRTTKLEVSDTTLTPFRTVSEEVFSETHPLVAPVCELVQPSVTQKAPLT